MCEVDLGCLAFGVPRGATKPSEELGFHLDFW